MRKTAVRGRVVSATRFRTVYGPVPSQRLGRSLGVDLVPFKTCTFDCVYCQLGRTTNKTLERREYFPVAEIADALKRKLAEEDAPDAITLAGSGEPALNSGIGDLIVEIKRMSNIPVAVLTNGALLWRSDVQDALMPADLVLPSLDAGDERLFRYVNRPHEDLSFDRMVDGIASFTRRFRGAVRLEVMLLSGVTGMPPEARKIAALVERIAPDRVQLNTVSRPPAETFAFPLSADRMRLLKNFFPGEVELIGEREQAVSDTPARAGIEDDDVMGLIGRRPCTFVDVATGLGVHVTEAVKHLDALVAAGKVKTVLEAGRTFYAVARLKEIPRS
jgi:wyosine [tRNA(Phe)-imidazoG37] synthetase (radical SAM superfamily)